MTRALNPLVAVGQRQIGPIGTASRVLVGLSAITLPIALSGISSLEVAAALLALPLIATAAAALVAAAYRRLAPAALRRRGALCSGPACLLAAVMVGAVVLLGVLTPVDVEVVLWVWIGASMLLAAVRGYGGCELLAAPNLISGRREEIGCILFTPIDQAEARHERADREGRFGGALLMAHPGQKDSQVPPSREKAAPGSGSPGGAATGLAGLGLAAIAVACCAGPAAVLGLVGGVTLSAAIGGLAGAAVIALSLSLSLSLSLIRGRSCESAMDREQREAETSGERAWSDAAR
ncbi:MAG: DUF6410 domain-containing protein [Solirubrobacterales bacterium]